MASPQLSRLHSLDDAVIDIEVTRTSAGVYVLDKTTAGAFEAAYVGRSDTDVNGRLHQHVRRYKFFMFGYSSSAKAAFEAECQLYHDLRPPDNANHPARPAGSGWRCPRCRVFD
jgi:hypothetical protein